MNTWQILLCTPRKCTFSTSPEATSSRQASWVRVTAPSSGSLRGCSSRDRPSPDLSHLLLPLSLPGGHGGGTQLCAAGGGLRPGPELGPVHVRSRSECRKGVSDGRWTWLTFLFLFASQSRFYVEETASSWAQLCSSPCRGGAGRGTCGGPMNCRVLVAPEPRCLPPAAGSLQPAKRSRNYK